MSFSLKIHQQILELCRVLLQLATTEKHRPGARFSKLPVITGPVKMLSFPFQTGVSKGLKVIQWSYQLKKQNGLHYKSEHTLLFLRLWLQNMISGPLSYRVFRETGPREHKWCPSDFQMFFKCFFKCFSSVFQVFLGFLSAERLAQHNSWRRTHSHTDDVFNEAPAFSSLISKMLRG